MRRRDEKGARRIFADARSRRRQKRETTVRRKVAERGLRGLGPVIRIDCRPRRAVDRATADETAIQQDGERIRQQYVGSDEGWPRSPVQGFQSRSQTTRGAGSRPCSGAFTTTILSSVRSQRVRPFVTTTSTDRSSWMGGRSRISTTRCRSRLSTTPAAIPALVVPAGRSANGLPIGIQIAAPHYAENELIHFGKLIEQLGVAFTKPDGYQRPAFSTGLLVGRFRDTGRRKCPINCAAVGGRAIARVGIRPGSQAPSRKAARSGAGWARIRVR